MCYPLFKVTTDTKPPVLESDKEYLKERSLTFKVFSPDTYTVPAGTRMIIKLDIGYCSDFYGYTFSNSSAAFMDGLIITPIYFNFENNAQGVQLLPRVQIYNSNALCSLISNWFFHVNLLKFSLGF